MMNIPTDSNLYQVESTNSNLPSKNQTQRSRSPEGSRLKGGLPPLFINVLQQNGLLDSSPQKVKIMTKEYLTQYMLDFFEYYSKQKGATDPPASEFIKYLVKLCLIARRQNDNSSLKRNSNVVAHSLASYNHTSHEMSFFYDVFTQRNSMVKTIGNYLSSRKVVKNFFSSKPTLDHVKLSLNVWTTLVNKIFKDQPPFQIIENLKQKIAATNKQRALEVQNDRRPSDGRTRDLEMNPFNTYSHNLEVDAFYFIVLCTEEFQNIPKLGLHSNDKRTEIPGAINTSPRTVTFKQTNNTSPKKTNGYMTSPSRREETNYGSGYQDPLRPLYSLQTQEDEPYQSIKLHQTENDSTERSNYQEKTRQSGRNRSTDKCKNGDYNALVQERMSIKKELSIQTLEKRAALENLLWTVDSYDLLSQKNVEVYAALKDMQKAFQNVLDKVKAAEPAIAKDINMTFFKKFITNRPSEPDTKRTKNVTSIKAKFASKPVDTSKINPSIIFGNDSEEENGGISLDNSFQPRIFTSKLSKALVEQDLEEERNLAKQEAELASKQISKEQAKNVIDRKSQSEKAPQQNLTQKESSLNTNTKAEISSIKNTKTTPVKPIAPEKANVTKEEQSLKSKIANEPKVDKKNARIESGDIVPSNITKPPTETKIDTKSSGKVVQPVQKTEKSTTENKEKEQVSKTISPTKANAPLSQEPNKSVTSETKAKVAAETSLKEDIKKHPETLKNSSASLEKPLPISKPEASPDSATVKPNPSTTEKSVSNVSKPEVPVTSLNKPPQTKEPSLSEQKPAESKSITNLQSPDAKPKNNTTIATQPPAEPISGKVTTEKSKEPEPIKPTSLSKKLPPPPSKDLSQKTTSAMIGTNAEAEKPKQVSVPERKPSVVSSSSQPSVTTKIPSVAAANADVAKKSDQVKSKVVVVKLPAGASVIRGQVLVPPKISMPLAIKIIMGTSFEQVLAKDPKLEALHNEILQREREEMVIEDSSSAPKKLETPVKLSTSLPANATIIKGNLSPPPKIGLPLGIQITMGASFEQTLAKNPDLAALHQAILQRKPEPVQEIVSALQPQAAMTTMSLPNNASLIKGHLDTPPKINIPLGIQIAMGPAFEQLLAKDPKMAALHKEILQRKPAPVQEAPPQMKSSQSTISSNTQSNNANTVKGSLPPPPKITIPLGIQIAMGPAFEQLLAKDPKIAAFHKEILQRKPAPDQEAPSQIKPSQSSSSSNTQVSNANTVKGNLPSPPKITIPLGIQIAMGPAFEQLLAKDPKIAALHKEILQRKPEPVQEAPPQMKPLQSAVSSNTQASNSNTVKGNLPLPPKIGIPLGIQIAMGPAFEQLIAKDPKVAALHKEILQRKPSPVQEDLPQPKSQSQNTSISNNQANNSNIVKGQLSAPPKINIPLGIQIVMGAAFEQLISKDPKMAALHKEILQRKPAPDQEAPSQIKPPQSNSSSNTQASSSNVVKGNLSSPPKISIPLGIQIAMGPAFEQLISKDPKMAALHKEILQRKPAPDQEAPPQIKPPQSSSSSNTQASSSNVVKGNLPPPPKITIPLGIQVAMGPAFEQLLAKDPQAASLHQEILRRKPQATEESGAPQKSNTTAPAQSSHSSSAATPIKGDLPQPPKITLSQAIQLVMGINSNTTASAASKDKPKDVTDPKATEQKTQDASKPKFAVPKFLKKNAEQPPAESQTQAQPQATSQQPTASSPAEVKVENKTQEANKTEESKQKSDPPASNSQSQGVTNNQAIPPTNPTNASLDQGLKVTAPVVSNPTQVSEPVTEQKPVDTKPKFAVPKFLKKNAEQAPAAADSQTQPTSQPVISQQTTAPSQAEVKVEPPTQEISKDSAENKKETNIQPQALPQEQPQAPVESIVSKEPEQSSATKPKFALPKFLKKPATDQAPSQTEAPAVVQSQEQVPKSTPADKEATQKTEGNINTQQPISTEHSTSKPNTEQIPSDQKSQPQSQVETIAQQPTVSLQPQAHSEPEKLPVSATLPQEQASKEATHTEAPVKPESKLEPEKKVEEEVKSQPQVIAQAQPQPQTESVTEQIPAPTTTKPKFNLPKFVKKPAAEQPPAQTQPPASVTQPEEQAAKPTTVAPVSDEPTKKPDVSIVSEQQINSTTPIPTQPGAPVQPEPKVEPEKKAEEETKAQVQATSQIQPQSQAGTTTEQVTEQPGGTNTTVKPKFTLPKFVKKPATEQVPSQTQSPAAATAQVQEQPVNTSTPTPISEESAKKPEAPLVQDTQVSNINTEKPTEEAKGESKEEKVSAPQTNTETQKSAEVSNPTEVKPEATSVNNDATAPKEQAAPTASANAEEKPIEKKFAPPKFKIPKFGKKPE